MDETSRKVLTAIHDFLDRLTKADNLTSEQLTEAFMSATALGYQIARMGYPAAAIDEAKSTEAALADRIAKGPVGPARTRLWADHWRDQPGEQLCAALEAESLTSDPVLRGEVREFLVRYHEPMDPAVGQGTRSTYAGGRGDARQSGDQGETRELTAEALEDWLHSTGNAASDQRVTAFRRLMGGYSKATYTASFGNGAGETAVVIRKDSPGLPTGSSVTAEFPVLREMAAIGVPVPAPLWLEADPTICDEAFMGVAFAPGTPANQIVPTDPAVRARWAQSCAEVLGTLHSRTSVTGGDVRQPLAREIDDLERRMLERERAPHPGLQIGLAWLRGNLNRLEGRPACRIHGDFGFHNLLIKDDAVSALLDWEFSRLGDPVEDLASIKPFMDQINAWNQFYACYRDMCGFTLDPVADGFFKVWQEARNMTACLGSLNSLLMPGVKDIPLTVAGTIYIPKYEIAILDAITAVEDNHD